MKNCMLLSLFSVTLLVMGCAMVMPVSSGAVEAGLNEVTTASGVRIDPDKHRAITYQMW